MNEKYSIKKAEIIEYTMEDETRYLITFTNGENTCTLKASGNGKLEVYKKQIGGEAFVF